MDASESFRECFFHLLLMLQPCRIVMRRHLCYNAFGPQRRNGKVWKGVMQPVNQVINQAKDFYHEWGLARTTSTAATAHAAYQNLALHKWQKPSVGFYKCNVDAALFTNDNKYGLGISIRTDTSSFYKSKTMWFNGTPIPQEAETMGLWQTLIWLGELGLSSISIVLDCLPVVNGLKIRPHTNTKFGVLMSYCRTLLSSFLSFQVSFVRRQANLAAHTLARASRLMLVPKFMI